MDIEKLKALALAATPGPWARHQHDAFTVRGDEAKRECIADAETQDDARFIAAAHPAAVLELIAEVERLSAALEARIEEGKDNT